MKPGSSLGRILCAAWVLAIVPASFADELTPETYVAVEAEVRELTLEGMAQRVSLLSGGSNPEFEALLDAANRQQVRQAFQDNDTTANAHAAYGTQNADEIAAWLDANPDWQAHLDSLAQEFESLSNQLDALREGSE